MSNSILYMNIARLLNTAVGKIIISIILGLGLATIFREVCNERNCIRFSGPIISEENVYKHDGKCSKYVLESTKCNTNKKIIDLESIPEKKKLYGIL